MQESFTMKFLNFTCIAAVTSGVIAQELEIEVTYAVECASKTKNGGFINVNYNGTFTNGTVFDSSLFS